MSLATLNGTRLLDNLLAFGQDKFDVAWVGHVWVDLMYLSVASSLSYSLQIMSVELTRPWARYVRRRCLGAWLTWMCLTTRLPVSRPLVSAFASAFLRRPSKNSADFTGHLARETPNCLPIHHKSCQHMFPSRILLSPSPISVGRADSYPAKRDQFLQRIFSLGRPPCAPGRSQGTSQHAAISIRL